VKRNMSSLVDSGQLGPAMQLALELMKEGSLQVEMSDEGMMTDDIEDCLSVVLKRLKKGELPADEVITWCSANSVMTMRNESDHPESAGVPQKMSPIVQHDQESFLVGLLFLGAAPTAGRLFPGFWMLY
jgi:hypothetical protein